MTFKSSFDKNDRVDYPAQGMPMTGGSYSGMTPMPKSGQMGQMGGLQVQQPLPPTPSGYPTGATTMPLLPPLPSGYPTGATTMPLLPTQTGLPALPGAEQQPTTVQSTLYTPGFLRTQIGKRMRIEFLIGTGALVDRSGTLLQVGASYIIIRLIDSDDLMLCDIYSIKFVTIFL